MLSQDGSGPARDAGEAEVSRATDHRQAGPAWGPSPTGTTDL